MVPAVIYAEVSPWRRAAFGSRATWPGAPPQWGGRPPLARACPRRPVRDAARRAAIGERRAPRTPRRLFAAQLPEDGHDVRTVRERLGHRGAAPTPGSTRTSSTAARGGGAVTGTALMPRAESAGIRDGIGGWASAAYPGRGASGRARQGIESIEERRWSPVSEAA
jgi:hypothetical protein